MKTFSRRDGHIVLTPANPAYEPMVFDGEDDVTIFGKVSPSSARFDVHHRLRPRRI